MEKEAGEEGRRGEKEEGVQKSSRSYPVWLTSSLKEGLKCLWSSMMTRRHTKTFSSFSTSSRENMVDRIV